MFLEETFDNKYLSKARRADLVLKHVCHRNVGALFSQLHVNILREAAPDWFNPQLHGTCVDISLVYSWQALSWTDQVAAWEKDTGCCLFHSPYF